MALEDLNPQLPRFTGSDPNSWISQSELYFRFYSIFGDERFAYVIEVFEDEPFYWFNSWFRSDDLTWNDFTTAMIHQFCSSLKPTVDTVVNSSPPLSALQVFDEMHDRVKHEIFSVDHETKNDEVLKGHTDSMVDVHESFEVTDTQPDLLDSNFVLQDVKSSPHCPTSSSDSPQPNPTSINTSTWHCLEIQMMRSGKFSSALLVVHNFEWKPGWYCGGIEYATRIHDVVVDAPLGSPQTESQDDANESLEVKDAQMDILDDVVLANDTTTKDMVDTNDCDVVASFVIKHHKVRWLRMDSMVIQPISTQMVVTASQVIRLFAWTPGILNPLARELMHELQDAYQITLDSKLSNQIYDLNSDQYNWLKADISSVDHKKTPWLLALFYVPWYNNIHAHQGEGDMMMKAMEPLFYVMGVDIVFADNMQCVYNGKSTLCDPVHITTGEKRYKAKSCVTKQPRKAFLPSAGPNKISASLVGETSTNMSFDFTGLVKNEPSAAFLSVASRLLAPIFTPTVYGIRSHNSTHLQREFASTSLGVVDNHGSAITFANTASYYIDPGGSPFLLTYCISNLCLDSVVTVHSPNSHVLYCDANINNIPHVALLSWSSGSPNMMPKYVNGGSRDIKTKFIIVEIHLQSFGIPARSFKPNHYLSVAAKYTCLTHNIPNPSPGNHLSSRQFGSQAFTIVNSDLESPGIDQLIFERVLYLLMDVPTFNGISYTCAPMVILMALETHIIVTTPYPAQGLRKTQHYANEYILGDQSQKGDISVSQHAEFLFHHFTYVLELSECRFAHGEVDLSNSAYAIRKDLLQNVFDIDIAESYLDSLLLNANTTTPHTSLLPVLCGIAPTEVTCFHTTGSIVHHVCTVFSFVDDLTARYDATLDVSFWVVPAECDSLGLQMFLQINDVSLLPIPQHTKFYRLNVALPIYMASERNPGWQSASLLQPYNFLDIAWPMILHIAQLVRAIPLFAALYGHTPLELAFYTFDYSSIALLQIQPWKWAPMFTRLNDFTLVRYFCADRSGRARDHTLTRLIW